MAKAKKTTASGDAAPAPKKTAAPRSSKKKAAPAAAPAATGVPMIDTANAASNAAKLLAAKAKQLEPQKQEVAKESGGFKQLKESLNRPTASQSANLLGNALGSSKSGLPFHQQGSKQVAHNQTFGGAGRVGVPRRTNG